MPSPKNDSSCPLTLTVLFPDADPITVSCDAVRFQIPDDLKGRGGGSYGIHPGHAPTVFSLAPGDILADAEGKTVWQQRCAGGFVRVTQYSVTVVTEGGS